MRRPRALSGEGLMREGGRGSSLLSLNQFKSGDRGSRTHAIAPPLPNGAKQDHGTATGWRRCVLWGKVGGGGRGRDRLRGVVKVFFLDFFAMLLNSRV